MKNRSGPNGVLGQGPRGGVAVQPVSRRARPLAQVVAPLAAHGTATAADVVLGHYLVADLQIDVLQPLP